MTYSTENVLHQSPGARFSVAIADAVMNQVQSFAASLSRATLRRRTANELQRLSDHQLRDIGIHRGDIAQLADSLVKY